MKEQTKEQLEQQLESAPDMETRMNIKDQIRELEGKKATCGFNGEGCEECGS